MTAIKNLPFSRRTFSQRGGGLLSGTVLLPMFEDDSETDDNLLLYEVKLLQEMADSTYNQLWANLKGVTEEELDWIGNQIRNQILSVG